MNTTSPKNLLKVSKSPKNLLKDNQNDREKESILMTTFKFDLLSLKKGDTEVPQYEICYKTLCNDAMCLSCLKQHLTTVHSALANKPKKFLVLKSHSLKKAKLDMCGTFQQSF